MFSVYSNTGFQHMSILIDLVALENVDPWPVRETGEQHRCLCVSFTLSFILLFIYVVTQMCTLF